MKTTNAEAIKAVLKACRDNGVTMEDVLLAYAEMVEEKEDVNSSKQQTDLETEVSEMLREIGVPANLKGYRYVRTGIIMSVEDPTVLGQLTKVLYPAIAKEFKSTTSRVERAIRHAIEVAWNRGDMDVLNKYFGYTIDMDRGKPTNAEFIAMIADKISLQLKA